MSKYSNSLPWTAEEITNTIGPRIICSYLVSELEQVKKKRKSRKKEENRMIVNCDDEFTSEMKLETLNDDTEHTHAVIRPIPSFIVTLSAKGDAIPKTNNVVNTCHPILQLPQKNVCPREEKVRKNVEFSPVVEARHESRVIVIRKPSPKEIKVDSEIRSLKETIVCVNKKINHILDKIILTPEPPDKTKALHPSESVTIKGQESVQMAKDAKEQKPTTTPKNPDNSPKKNEQSTQKDAPVQSPHGKQAQSMQATQQAIAKGLQTPRKLETSQQSSTKTQTSVRGLPKAPPLVQKDTKSTQHKAHKETIEKTTQANESKAGLMVRKLARLLTKSTTKKSDLLVIKPSDSTLSDDDFMPAPPTARKSKNIVVAEDLTEESKEAIKIKLDQKGEFFETGEWFETADGQSKSDDLKLKIKGTFPLSDDEAHEKLYPSKVSVSSGEFCSVCVLPTKQVSQSHLELFVDKAHSRSFSENFEIAMEDFKTKHGESLSKDYIKNKKINEIIDAKFTPPDEETEKQRFINTIKNKVLQIKASHDELRNSNKDNESATLLSSKTLLLHNTDGVKEKKSNETKGKTKDTDKAKKKAHKDKTVSKQKDAFTTPLRILNSDEILRKNTEAENEKNRTKDK